MCFENIVYHFLFHPVPCDIEQIYEGVSYKLFKASENRRGLLIFSHGNSNNLKTVEKLADRLVYHGYDVLLYDYFGYGGSNGTPSPSGCVKSLKLMIELMQPNYKKITLWGDSLGTGVVIQYCMNTGWKDQIVLTSPFKSVMRLVIDIKHCIDYFNSIAAVPYLLCPAKIFHSEVDDVVPLYHSKDLMLRLNEVELVVVKNSNHNNIIYHIDLDSLGINYSRA